MTVPVHFHVKLPCCKLCADGLTRSSPFPFAVHDSWGKQSLPSKNQARRDFGCLDGRTGGCEGGSLVEAGFSALMNCSMALR